MDFGRQGQAHWYAARFGDVQAGYCLEDSRSGINERSVGDVPSALPNLAAYRWARP